ncbi:Lsm14a protein [Emericellopsis atlantica]|uniref:Lsm14a protein n=1 Tax=Emericellopsis atlantica TaxID=2614577 RepID=A0A9P7ZTK0_9HYPO|nr:Lsm14a protein [Emericellopsis atlantica]KAG9257571.1 Lsm14a protein [Emericellopsis atlantica]
MSEFLGSRISLISKSDIRYVGVLHEINSDESTVSLENVRSYGTEGRKDRPEEEVGPSDSVYEYIVFRGSDVKDLRIEERPGAKENQPPAMPDDPAIVGATRNRPGPPGPPGPGPQGPKPGQGPDFNPYNMPPPPFDPSYGPPGNWGRGGPPPPGPQGFGNMPYPPPPGWFGPGHPGQAFPPGAGGPGPGPWGNQPFPPGPPGPGGPGPHQPRGPHEQKPASRGPVDQPPQQAQPTQQSPAAARPPTNAPAPPVESKPSTEEVKNTAANLAGEAAKAPVPNKAPPAGPRQNRVNPVVPLGSLTKPFQPPIAQQQPPKAAVETTVSAAPGSVQDATSAARAAVAVAMAQLGNGGANQMDNLTNKVNEMRVGAARGGASAPRGRGRGGRPQGQAAKVEVPDSDFDFAQANAKFNKDDLIKEAIAGSPLGETTNGGEVPPPEVPQSEDVPVAYNKTRSFFDNISSEAKDRADTSSGGRPGGREWRDEEQRRNMETFGQGSVDGGHRRGRGRGRGRGGRGRGGQGRGGRGGNPQYQTAEGQ